MRAFLLVCPALFLAGCFTDHYGIEDRLSEDEKAEYRRYESAEAQLRWLKGKDILRPGDLRSPAFSRLDRDGRIELYREIRKDLTEAEARRLSSGEFSRQDSSEIILVIFGPPRESDDAAGVETWFYDRYEFHFVDGKLIDWVRY